MTITDNLPRLKKQPRVSKENALGERPPVKRRVRPVWLIAGLLLIVVGSLAVANVVGNAGKTTSVLVASKPLKAGEKVGGSVTTIQVSAGQQIDAYTGDQAPELVDKVAAFDVPQGALLSQNVLTNGLTPADGQSIVPVSLKPDRAPARPYASGDPVRIVDAGTAQGTQTTRGQDIPGKVLSIRTDGATQALIVDVLVKSGSASEAAARSARGAAILVVDSASKGS
ncbi:CpaB family protein [Arthrobacter woluwensis]|uniref:hypothetical protein n=1 Tax=Arthrobacter woluwensis TaxID=156980 RepID=UPI003822330B